MPRAGGRQHEAPVSRLRVRSSARSAPLRSLPFRGKRNECSPLGAQTTLTMEDAPVSEGSQERREPFWHIRGVLAQKQGPKICERWRYSWCVGRSTNQPPPQVRRGLGGCEQTLWLRILASLDAAQRRRRPARPASPSRAIAPGAGSEKVDSANCTGEPATPLL